MIIALRDGSNPAKLFTTRCANPGYEPGGRIGLSVEGSGSSGGTAIFDNW